MKQLRKILSFILIIGLAAGVLPALSGCAESKKDDPDTFLVYYTNQNADDIIFKEQTIRDAENMEQVELVQKLLDLMFTQDEEDTTYYTVCPDTIHLEGLIVKDGIITLDFNSDYLKMTNVREIIFRASVVLTLIQVSGITGVSFTVENNPIVNSYGENIGIMTSDRFVNVLLNEEGMLKQETDLTVFFANKDKTKLVPVVYRFDLDNSNSSMEEYVLTRLLAGPEGNDTNPTTAQGVMLNSVVTTDHICYVNFGANFLNQEQPVSDELMIYSIVNTLCQLPYVHSVQFMVNGDTNVTLHGSMDLSSPLLLDNSYTERN